MKPAHQVVDRILLTEKGTVQTEQHNQYIFKVHPDANKNDIKSAVETLFKVKVRKVNDKKFTATLKTNEPDRQEET